MEDLYIQLDDNGNPINHPMLLQSILWVDTAFDPAKLPKGYAKFIRHWPPQVGPNQTYDTHYEWVNGCVQDVFVIRDLTEQEITERDSHIQKMIDRHNLENPTHNPNVFTKPTSAKTTPIRGLQFNTPDPIQMSKPTQVQEPNLISAPEQMSQLVQVQEEPVQGQTAELTSIIPESIDTRDLVQNKIPDVQGIVVLINNIVVSFSSEVKLEAGFAPNEIFFYFEFTPGNLTRLESISQTPLERVNELPESYDGKVGDFYVIKFPASVYAWSGRTWLRVTYDTQTTSTESDAEDNAKFTDWVFSAPLNINLKVDRDTRNARIETCNQCDQLSMLKTCDQCGCLMPLKTWLKNSTCPLGKW